MSRKFLSSWFLSFYALMVLFLVLPGHSTFGTDKPLTKSEQVKARQRIEQLILDLEKDTKLPPEQRLEKATEAARLSEKLSYQPGMAKSYYYIGNSNRILNNNDESVKYLSKAIDLSRRLGDSITYAFANIRLSNVNRKLGKMEAAYKEIYAALKIAEHLKNNELLFPGYSQLASLYVTNNSLEKGLEYYEKAADVSRKQKNDEWLAMTYNNIGITYYSAQQYEKAISYYQKSLDLNMVSGNKIFLLDNYVNLGAIYQNVGKRQKSLDAFDQALKLIDEIGGREEQHLIILNDMAVDFDQNKEFHKAEQYLREALVLAKKINARAYEVQINKNLANALYQQKRFEEAIAFHGNYSDLKDSLYQVSRIEQLAEMESKYEAEKKSRQIELLQKDNLINQDRISRRTLERNAIIVVLFMSVLVSLLLIRIYKQRQRTTALLAAKNQELNNRHMQELIKEQQLKSMHALMDGQEQERRRIAADLHDGLGSMLATVKLHFKAAEQLLTDRPHLLSDARQLLDESIQEVRRISHNMVSGVLLKFGLVAAIEEMQKTLVNTGHIHVSLTVYGMQNRLSPELELPLYRIVQELVNNTLKHARATEIAIQINRFDDLLNLVVEDNGIGFDAETSGGARPGIGLSNIKTRLEQLNGSINIDSGLGNGSTFIVDVPLHQQQSNSELNFEENLATAPVS